MDADAMELTTADLEARVAGATTVVEKVDALNALGWALRSAEPSRALEIVNEAESLAREGEGSGEYVDGLSQSMLLKGAVYRMLGEYARALDLLTIARWRFAAAGDRRNEAE